MHFEFATAQRIIFGPGKLKELPSLTKELGNRTAFITGANAERIMPVFKMLKECGANPAAFSITKEPTTERIATLASQAKEMGCDHVVAFGGGSVIDAGKAIAALLTNTDDLMNYLEVIGAGQPLTEKPAPCIAIPTTAGTGAEVTRNAVLHSTEHNVKVSMRHADMLPTIALVDPELTLSMPKEITASTGLDAFTQLLEAFVSAKSNPLTDGLCREGLQRVSRSLHRAYQNGNDLEARTNMALGSLLGGLALANAGLGAVHGFAGPIGGMFQVPHGMVCASLLASVVNENISAMSNRTAEHDALKKYTEAACLTTGSPNATLASLRQWLADLCLQLGVPGLSNLGISDADFPAIIQKAKCASSMKGNPIELTDAELENILNRALFPAISQDSL